MKLPNIRSMFIPDPDYAIFDADLMGAEAMYAAWKCGGNFKADFISGRKIHVETMERFFPREFAINPKHEPQYTKCKNMMYGTLYAGKPRGISAAAAIPENIVSAFQDYFIYGAHARYPEIAKWHEAAQLELQLQRTAHNEFGFRIYYFDRIDGLLPEAINWQCQSTIAIVCQRASILMEDHFPHADLLLQNHDSLVFQLHRSKISDLGPIRKLLNSVRVPFPNGDDLYIPWGMAGSWKSWGDCKGIDFAPDGSHSFR